MYHRYLSLACARTRASLARRQRNPSSQASKQYSFAPTVPGASLRSKVACCTVHRLQIAAESSPCGCKGAAWRSSAQPGRAAEATIHRIHPSTQTLVGAQAQYWRPAAVSEEQGRACWCCRRARATGTRIVQPSMAPPRLQSDWLGRPLRGTHVARFRVAPCGCGCSLLHDNTGQGSYGVKSIGCNLLESHVRCPCGRRVARLRRSM